MKREMVMLLVSVLVAGRTAGAQTKADEAAVLQVPQVIAAAWAKHDGQQFANTMTEDVDFVNVNGEWLHGKANVALFHSRLLSGRFKSSTLRPIHVEYRFLRPDEAVIHWNWRVDGDRNMDGTLRKPRYGLFTMVVEKRGERWLICISHNSNWVPPPHPDPEMDGIKPMIVFPAAAERP